MKEIRTIKMVEQAEVKFVADDGKEFIGENAERDCRDYERQCNREQVESAYKRLDVIDLNTPFVHWFNDCNGFYIFNLKSKADYYAMMDYYKVILEYEYNIEEPENFPYTMTVAEGYDYVYEYGGNLKAELQKTLEQLG